MSERLQRVDIYTIDEGIEVKSVITNSHSDNLPNEELIGRFPSPTTAVSEIEKHRNAIRGLLGVDAIICAGAWLASLYSSMQEMAYAGRPEFDEASARVIASLSVATISYIAGKKLSSTIHMLENAKKGLEEAESTTGYPYSRNFDL